MNHLQNELAILGRFELTDTGRKYSKKRVYMDLSSV